MGFLETATKISVEFAEYVEAIAEMEFVFRGEHPWEHSSDNHIHLAGTEWWAARHPQIDLAFREKAVSYIFERWRLRLKSFHPYRQSGYRLYLYEDFAPTISVVAETPHGFPYGRNPTFCSSIAKVLQPFARQTNIIFQPIKEAVILTAIEGAQGSIGTRATQALGLNKSDLRKRIEWLEIGDQVNDLRKRFKRRPAKFVDLDLLLFDFRVFELRLPANYD